MSKILVKCVWCGKEVLRYPSQIRKNSYCSKDCRSKHISREHNPNGYTRHPHLSKLNQKLNPERMSDQIKAKISKARLGFGEGKTYEKTFGRHTHRIVAEQKIGRKLLPKEVVHHIDGNKRNNQPDNLMVFPSQKEHAEWHVKFERFFYGTVLGKEGDAK
jgi:hypothetical protein